MDLFQAMNTERARLREESRAAIAREQEVHHERLLASLRAERARDEAFFDRHARENSYEAFPTGKASDDEMGHEVQGSLVVAVVLNGAGRGDWGASAHAQARARRLHRGIRGFAHGPHYDVGDAEEWSEAAAIKRNL